MRILDVGCGIHKQPGAIGVDRNPASRADVLADLDHYPYPFADSSFGRVTAIHVIEHLENVIAAMEEFHRLLRPGGKLRIETPHPLPTDFSSFCDPTHKSHLNSFSFRYFGENHGGFGYYSKARFRELSVRVKLLAFWRWLGFEFLVNHFPRYRRFWEYYLCYIVRGKVIGVRNSKSSNSTTDRTRAAVFWLRQNEPRGRERTSYFGSPGAISGVGVAPR